VNASEKFFFLTSDWVSKQSTHGRVPDEHTSEPGAVATGQRLNQDFTSTAFGNREPGKELIVYREV
jgi:hypothetical protein